MSGTPVQVYVTCSDSGHSFCGLGPCAHCNSSSRAMPIHVLLTDGNTKLKHVCTNCKATNGFIRITKDTVDASGANVATKHGFHGILM